MRRGAVVFIIFLIAAAAVLAYYLQQKRAAFIASPYTTVPMDAGLLIEAVSLPDLIESIVSDNIIFEEMSQIKTLGKFTEGIIIMDSLLQLKEVRGLVSSNSVLISFHKMGKDRVESFFSLSLPPEVKERHLKEILSQNTSLRYSIKEYQGYSVYEVGSKGINSNNYYIAYINGVLILSRSNILVEAGIRQSEQTNDIRSVPGFKEVSAAASKNDSKIYIIFENFQKLISFISKSSTGILGDRVGDIAGSGETDIYLKSNKILISGYIETTDTSQILNRYTGFSASTFDSYTIIPSNVAMFESVMGAPVKTLGFKQDIVGITRYLADIVNSQFEGETAKLYFDITSEEDKGNRMAIYKLRGQNATETAFRDELDNYYSGSGKSVSQYVISYKPDDQTEFTLYKLPDNRLTELLAGGFCRSYKLNYATFYQGYLVLGESSGSLSKFIYDNILNRTLANDLTYREFESTLPSRSSYYFYAVPSRIINILENVINNEILNGLRENINSLKKVEAIGFQFSPSNEMLYSSLSISVREEVKEEARAQWESLLDTVLYSKPMFFTNHNTGKSEIFVQDLNDNVYLINSTGRVLWKIRIQEKILGEPVMIDFYRNKKYQILFATRNSLHLLDRNGNYVERYPVSLRSPASNGLSVFDYENNKDYRLFICGADKQVYLYDKSGSTVKGWSQFKTNGIVNKDIEHFRVSGKDYLVVNDEENMYLLDRRGNVRVRIAEQVARAKNSNLRLSSESSPRMVLSTNDGSVKLISFNGDVETVEINEFSSSHVFDYFDIDSDGLGEYIFIDDGKIYAYDNNHSKMFVENTQTNNIYGPYGLVFGTGDRKLGYVDSGSGEVHLIDHKGKDITGFPLIGNTPFSIGRLGGAGTFNLITGGRDSFIYNYEIKR